MICELDFQTSLDGGASHGVDTFEEEAPLLKVCKLFHIDEVLGYLVELAIVLSKLFLRVHRNVYLFCTQVFQVSASIATVAFASRIHCFDDCDKLIPILSFHFWFKRPDFCFINGCISDGAFDVLFVIKSGIVH
jgi:hypothetical protein